MTPDRTALSEPRLVVPEGWLIDQIARQRLMRQLDQAPARVTGVAAETDDLPPGASYRVHAEWRSLQPSSAALETAARSARGPVLVRPGVEFEVRGEVVEVDSGSLLVDPGAHAHDPWRRTRPLEVASELGRPPFPRRPVVVFIADEPDEDLAEWARRLVNRLVRRDIEGRLAMRTAAQGMHLTQPCLPSEESVRALAPDVVVPLDAAMAERVPAWCGTDRSTVVVEYVPDGDTEPEVVSWRLERASGRVRGRIGRHVDVASLVSLVERLCAGPHPLPPSDRAVRQPALPPAVKSSFGWPRTVTRTMVVITGTLDIASSRRVDGLVDHLSASGVIVDVCSAERRLPAAARSADLVWLAGTTGWEAFDDLIDARRAVAGATVIDLGPTDFEIGRESSVLSVARKAAQQAHKCGLVTVLAGIQHTAARRLDVRVHALPTVLTRQRAAELRAARPYSSATAELVVGWHIGSGLPTPAYLDAAAEALAKTLADWPDLRVEVVGDPARLPSMLHRHDRVDVALDEREPHDIAGWFVHLWTPPVLAGGVLGDALPFIEVSSVGVPSVFAAAGRTAIDGYLAPDLLVERVDRSEEWAGPLRALLDSHEMRDQRSSEAARRSNALYGHVGSKIAVNRFLGWARYGPAPS